jgi:hypothetical protein
MTGPCGWHATQCRASVRWSPSRCSQTMARSSRCCSASPLVAGSRPQAGQARWARAAAGRAAVWRLARWRSRGPGPAAWPAARRVRPTARSYRAGGGRRMVRGAGRRFCGTRRRFRRSRRRCTYVCRRRRSRRTALYVRSDDLLKQYPDLAPWRPKTGLQPRLTDAELVTLAAMQALLGYTSESRWLRYAHAHLGHLFRYLPGQPGYNRRLRAAAGLITTLIRLLAADTSLWTDDVWIVDSTRSNAAPPATPPAARTWPDGPDTDIAPATRATSGGCGCTWSPPSAACPPASR